MSVSEQNILDKILNRDFPESIQANIKADIKEWLQEYIMQPEVRNMKTTDELELNFTAGQIAILRKLLEELE